MLRNGLLAVAVVLVSAFTGLGAQAAGRIGKVVAVVGSPTASGRVLKAGSDVFEDDRIVVKTGNAQILLDDNTRIVVGPASTLLLDQFVMKDKGVASKVAIKALRGTYRFITGRSPKSAYKITTAQATIGIRGTGFDFWTIKKTGAAVMSGQVRLSGRNGGSTNLGSSCDVGEATTSSANVVKGRDKVALIKKNLPFILDQSSLRPRFRLNTRLCNIGVDLQDGGRNEPPPQRNRNDNGGTDGGNGGTDGGNGGTDGGNGGTDGVDPTRPAGD